VPNPDIIQQLSPIMTQTGLYFGGMSSLDYRRRWRRASFSAAGGTAARYYPDFKEFTRIRDYGTVAFTYAFGPKTTLNASQAVWYSPYFMNGWFPGMNPSVPGQPITPGYDNYTYYRPNWQFNTAIDFQRRLTRPPRSPRMASSTTSTSCRRALPARDVYAAQLAFATSTACRDLALRAGYSFNKYATADLHPRRAHARRQYRLGLDYHKTLKVGGANNIGARRRHLHHVPGEPLHVLIHAYATTVLTQVVRQPLLDRNFSFVEGLLRHTTDSVR
jgi:hypothetical protein